MLSRKKIRWLPLGLSLASLARSLPAGATDFLVEIACPEWAAESRGQVEARLRVTVLAEALDARRIQINCQDEAVGISVESSTGAITRAVERSRAPIEDVVVTAVEAALRELAARSRSQQAMLPAPPPTEPAPAPVAPAPAPATSLATAAPRGATPASPGTPLYRSVSELYATPTVELFEKHWALGGTLGVAVGTETLQYGLELGGRTISGLPASFDATEWGASLRLAWTPGRAAGFRGMLGLGASALVTKPADDVVLLSPSPVLSVAYIELQVSRPFWLGRLGVAPGLGVRLFSDGRNVQVNLKEQLALPWLTPEATLSFIYRR